MRILEPFGVQMPPTERAVNANCVKLIKEAAPDELVFFVVLLPFWAYSRFSGFSNGLYQVCFVARPERSGPQEWWWDVVMYDLLTGEPLAMQQNRPTT